MISRILCSVCKETLREGDSDAEPEYKICPKCVIAGAQTGNLDHLNQVQKKLPKELTPNAAALELDNLRKKMSKINVEIVFKSIRGEMHAVFEFSDYYKKMFAEIGFSKDKLLEFIKDIEKYQEIEDEQKEAN